MGLKYLALGDSYTIGEGVETQQNFPNILTTSLNNQGCLLDNPQIIATTGWTTDELLSAIRDKKDEIDAYDLVTLLIGVNNQYRGYLIEQFKVEFTKLINCAIDSCKLGAEGVIVVSIPNWGNTTFAKNKGCDTLKIKYEIASYNQIKKLICDTLGVTFVDITPLTEVVDIEQYLTEDTLHYNEKMYQMWSEEITKAMH